MPRVSGKLSNLKSKKLYLQVYEALKNYILDNHLKPGNKLPTEMEMCTMLKVSRNVLREAIKALEIAGIVSSKPGVGIVLQDFNANFAFESLIYHLEWNSEYILDQSLAVRRALELGFLHEAFITSNENTIKHLQHCVDKMNSYYKKLGSDPNKPYMFGIDFYEADANFHKYLYENVSNKLLSSIVDAVWASDKYYKTSLHLKHLENTIVKHQRILQALKDKDEQAFIDAVHYHFDINYKLSPE